MRRQPSQSMHRSQATGREIPDLHAPEVLRLDVKAVFSTNSCSSPGRCLSFLGINYSIPTQKVVGENSPFCLLTRSDQTRQPRRGSRPGFDGSRQQFGFASTELGSRRNGSWVYSTLFRSPAHKG